MANLKLKCLLLALGVLAVCSMAASRELSEMSMAERHEQWMTKYGREYKDAAERDHRFGIFKSNMELIESFNAGSHKFKLGANQFADLSNEEFRARNGFKPSATRSPTGFRHGNVAAVPASMDWRTKGAVTPVKDQGQCGEYYYINDDKTKSNLRG